MYCWWHSEYRCDCFNEIRNKITGNRKGFARIHLRTESVDRYRILKLSKQKWRDHSLIMICVSLARAPHYCRCLTSVIGSHAYSCWSRDNCAWPRDRLRGPTGKTKVEQKLSIGLLHKWNIIISISVEFADIKHIEIQDVPRKEPKPVSRIWVGGK